MSHLYCTEEIQEKTDSQSYKTNLCQFVLVILKVNYKFHDTYKAMQCFQTTWLMNNSCIVQETVALGSKSECESVYNGQGFELHMNPKAFDARKGLMWNK